MATVRLKNISTLKISVVAILVTIPLILFQYLYDTRLHDMWSHGVKCTESSYPTGHVCLTTSSLYHKLFFGVWLVGALLIYFSLKKLNAKKSWLIILLANLVSIVAVPLILVATAYGAGDGGGIGFAIAGITLGLLVYPASYVFFTKIFNPD